MEEQSCRICFEKGNEELIIPCNCTGSMQFVHESCLNSWRCLSNNSMSFYQCEQCKYFYKFERTKWANILESKLFVGVMNIIMFSSITLLFACICYPLHLSTIFFQLVQIDLQLTEYVLFIISGFIGNSFYGIYIAIKEMYAINRWNNYNWLISLITSLFSNDIRITRVFVCFGIFVSAKNIVKKVGDTTKYLMVKFGTRLLQVSG